jgi:hypothetical protein
LKAVPAGLEDVAQTLRTTAERNMINKALSKIELSEQRNITCFDQFCFIIRIAFSEWTKLSVQNAEQIAKTSAAKLSARGGGFGECEIDDIWRKAVKSVMASNAYIDDPAFAMIPKQ